MMKPVPVIAIFDAGKTNKKLFLFDKEYNIVFEQAIQVQETKDEDGDPCEDVEALRSSFVDTLKNVLEQDQFDVKAINYTAYGASFEYLGEQGNILTPLYNYLKAYPAHLQKEFYIRYGGETEFSHRTASPILGSLNSGLQLYRLRYEKPGVFKKIRAALHLPQYLCYIFTGHYFSDMTSIGSHTALWDFTTNDYHEWVEKERVKEKLAPIHPHTDIINIVFQGKQIVSGIGLHDSSSALIPYLAGNSESFVLISTGTWSITLNPFNQFPLTTEELEQDCLCYFSYQGTPVKASRLFAGHEHDEKIKLLASHFNKPIGYYQQIAFNPLFINNEREGNIQDFETYEEAYHAMLSELIRKQVVATNLVMTTDTKHIFVDGGFSKNPVFMHLLAEAMPGKKVYAATIAQSTALGAALAIHFAWNDLPLPKNSINLKHYPAGKEVKFS